MYIHINLFKRLLPKPVIQPILQKVQPGEIRVTSHDPQFNRLHGVSYELAQKLNKKILGDPNKTIDVAIMKEGVLFTRRWSGKQKVWTFRIEDLAKVAARLNKTYDAVVLEKVQPGEIRVTPYDPQFNRLHGESVDLAQWLNEELGDPNITIKETNMLEGCDVLFTRRQNGSIKVWTFRIEDLAKVAARLNKTYDAVVLEKVQPGEIRVTPCDPQFNRLHGKSKDLAQWLNEELGNPNITIKDTNMLEGCDVFFTRRQSGANKVWTFRMEDFIKVQRMLIEKGIINPYNFFGWNEELEGGGDSLRLDDPIVKFDSGEERKIGMLLRKYGVLSSFCPGKNMQVRPMKKNGYRFDFIIDAKFGDKKIIIEYHPPFIEDSKEQKRVDDEFQKLVEGINNPAAVDDLLNLHSDINYKPKSALIQKVLGRQVNLSGRDLYDIQRLLLMELNPAFHNHKYIRINKIKELFDLLIWPQYYEPQKKYSKELAFADFKKYCKQIEEILQKQDEIIFRDIFGIEFSKTKALPTILQSASNG